MPKVNENVDFTLAANDVSINIYTIIFKFSKTYRIEPGV